MVPQDYHDFFIGAVTVAAALVGLLFVAISVNPGGAGGDGHLILRFRAGSALTAFLNALFLSLVALLPGSSLAGVALALGISGVLTMLSLLLVVALRRARGLGPWQLARMVLLIVGQCVVYVIQIVSALNLLTDPGAIGSVGTLATLIIVCFAIGAVRAWEYVGAERTGLLGALVEARREAARRGGQLDEALRVDEALRGAGSGGEQRDAG